MNVAEAGLHFGHGFGPARAVGHIQQHGHHLVLRREIAHGFFERLFAEVRDRHLHARLGERDGHAEAHAAGTPGDEGSLAGYVFHVGSKVLANTLAE